MSRSRKIQYTDDAITTLTFDPPKPGPDAISSTLWNACKDIAEAALQTKFIQGLGDGTLDPT
ncbi:MAG: TenA family transcriptional regulator, partial [Verrucomicrobiota bacterium]